MPKLKPLKQQTIVLTGASSGIGLATAELAAKRGARLVIASRNGAELDRIATRLRARGAEVEAVVTDVSDEAQVQELAARAIARFGGFDSWVNDAAAAVYGALDEIPTTDHRQVFDIGYWGLVYGSLAAAAHLRTRGGGAIVNVGSVLSERAMIYQGPYSAMKHAVRGFTDALRMELEAKRAQISVTLIKPAGMNTPYPEHARNYLDTPVRIPPVVYDPRLVARAILHACERPTREMTVGGTGFLIAKTGVILPRITDRVMEAFGLGMQSIGKPAPPARKDNLYQPREDGTIESAQPIETRRTSLFLEAQMRPWLPIVSACVVAGIALAGLGGARRGR